MAKQAPGGTDFLHYLDVALGSALGDGAPTAHEVPPELEQSFSPETYASVQGRRAGQLFLCVASRSRRDRPLAIEIPVWQHEHAGWLITCLTEQGRGGHPEPGYPPELLVAHQAARIAPIEREAPSRAFLRSLARERPEMSSLHARAGTQHQRDVAELVRQQARLLRESVGAPQQRALAKIAGIPRATWTNLESGAANPTVAVLHKVAAALQVSIEELLEKPRAECELFPFGALPQRTQGQGLVRKLLPHAIPGMEMDRIELPPGGRMFGIPHTPGSREYLTCEAGEIELLAAGERWLLGPGDVLAFRGDQRHSYVNPGTRRAIAYSVVVLAPAISL